MAILILPARDYANMLEKAVGTRSLKIRRQIQMLRAKKRANNVTRINLQQEQAAVLTGAIYEAFFSYMDKEALRDQLDAYVDKEDQDTDPPAIVYSMSEWKAVVETASGLTSSIDLKRFGNWNIYFNFANATEEIYPHVLNIIAAAHGVSNEDVEIPAVEPKEGDTRFNHLNQQPEKFVNGAWIVLETLDEEFAGKFGVIASETEETNL